MKLVFLLLGLFAGACVCLQCETEEVQDFAWEGWKLKYNRSYGLDEELRKKIWANNMLYVKEFNAEGHSYKLAANQFADLTNLEYRQIYLGYDNEARLSRKREGKVFQRKMKDEDLPTTVDWRSKGVVTPVKNQGQCGSCWSFSATGSLEGQYAIKSGKLVSFSEQELVDCSTSLGNHGCQGGLMDYAFKYWETNLAEKESDYTYTAKNGKCKYNAQLGVTKDSSFTDIPRENCDALKEAVANKGPIAVAMDASHTSFQMYHSGIYTPFLCSKTKLDHGVLVVGYGTDNGVDYWLVKNSWGMAWGMDGYFKIEMKSDKCGICTQASYPNL